MTLIEEERIFRDLLRGCDGFTGSIFRFILRLIHVHVLEVEDVLFHLNSAVMMPARPAGLTSADGTEDDVSDSDDARVQQQQDAVSGLDVIGVALRQFEFDPAKRLLIAGHTDTSGEPAMNFALSDLRARNVFALLTGNRAEWARISADRHRIEDYQQILTWISGEPRWGWPCDPQGIDNTWGTHTRDATEQFVQRYNAAFASSPADLPADGSPPPPDYRAPLPANMHRQIDGAAGHRWPEPGWAAFFDLYQDHLAHRLGLSVPDLVSLQTNRPRFISEDVKFVGCGESFPVDDAERSNYRSQLNRRVELLFFDAHEVPNLDAPTMACPADRTRVHERAECPLYNGCHYLPVYISPEDLTAVAYHLQFMYWDRISGSRECVPEGLEIQAFEDGDAPVAARVQYSGGTYTVKVPHNPARTKLYFQFAAPGKWIFTADASSASPRLVDLTPEQYAALPAHERAHYYDLPAVWSSRNYWTRGAGAAYTGGKRFEEVMAADRQLKPYGANTTTFEQPLVFSLDDIVLLDSVGGSQDIKDANHRGAERNLAAKSRVKLLVVDPATGFLKLYQPGADLNSARIPFARNLITEPAEDVKIVFFRDGFYPVGRRRTEPSPNWPANGFVVGARAAVRNDSDYHCTWALQETRTEFASTGDFDLHYFHALHVDDEHPISFTISYASMSFMADTRAPAQFGPIPTEAEVDNFRNQGCYRAMDVWNRKQLFMEEIAPSARTVIIRHFYFFDEREHFKPTAPAGGWVNCNFDNQPSDNAADNFETLFAQQALRDAERDALGGKAKFLALVCRNENGDWGPAYQWAIRDSANRPYSLLKLNKSCYQDTPTILNGISVTEHGDTWVPNTMAHELGHGTGQPDEYIRRQFTPHSGANAGANANFIQHYIPYSMPFNNGSLMYWNCAPRLRYLWYPMRKINVESRRVGSPLRALLPDKTFVARLDRPSFVFTFHRKVTGGNPSVPAVKEDPIASEKQYELTSSPVRKLSLELYDVGRDESSRDTFHAAQGGRVYHAVLVVRVLMKIEWTGSWTDNRKRDRIVEIEDAFKAWGGHYRLEGGTGDIRDIYIHFLPGFYASSDGDTESDKHYDVELTRGAETAISTGFWDSSDLEVSRVITGAQLVDYFFNRASGQTGEQALHFLADWADGRLPGTFTLHSWGGPP
ncbi:MAG TPA: hypothetical protein PK186_14100 [candidate division Zixibacteria bacterium]|nr:hypothetical protein [candidate division Zixibacteria bacterium]MDM7972094.1 hypothetical protein [candidate division Zixibacteria bacterium]HOD65071.1 hypothetical protein [candidate division Zixibacteria bacterium]HPM38679.1 hypothetical protein [candidate division Zixibacteria bacterium]